VVEKTTSEFPIPKKSYSIEFMVGLFTLGGLLCFAYLAVNIAQMRFLNTGYHNIYAEFSNVSGLKEGAPVEIAGVQVGEVTKINLKETNALVTMNIRDGVEFRDDDIASIRTKGIIGDRYVKILPGSSDAMVKVGGTVGDTESAVDLEEILGKLIHQMGK
jgi:phospholipid/cholesterol/gamma-HCH transport system substrate-binding protein